MLFVALNGRLDGRSPSSLLCRLRADQIIVIDKVVAVADEKIGGRLFDTDADNGLVVLAQLAHERGKIRVTADDGKGVNMAFGVTEVESIDDHADIGGILS